MWDIKLQFLDLIKELFLIILFLFNNFLNILINYYNHSISINSFNLNYEFIFNNSIIFAVKFLLSIAFLVLIRGGTPRYRYDYLTKLGWLKFINIIIFIFFFSILNFYLF